MSNVSNAVRKLIEERAPKRPWSGQVKNGAHVRPLRTALSEPYIQLNPPCLAGWLIFDIDREGGALGWEDANLPPPTVAVGNPENGHAHVFYALAVPVCTSTAGRQHPLDYLVAVEYAYRQKLGADAAFTGRLAKNPVHDHWRVYEPANCPVYTLGELAEYVDLPKRLPGRRESLGYGRNCSLFEDLRKWAYVAIRQYWRPGGQEMWTEACVRQAQLWNTFDHAEPLEWSEVKGIARSVSRWTWKHITPMGFRQKQAERGRLGGRPRTTTAGGEPWAAAGISRATFYRLLKK